MTPLSILPEDPIAALRGAFLSTNINHAKANPFASEDSSEVGPQSIKMIIQKGLPQSGERVTIIQEKLAPQIEKKKKTSPVIEADSDATEMIKRDPCPGLCFGKEANPTKESSEMLSPEANYERKGKAPMQDTNDKPQKAVKPQPATEGDKPRSTALRIGN